ncbi:hypothetical protein LEP1GSC016_3118 [Leptospira borgpetersenii serovar Hardjo-bovis str. Sponselee]|uniref:Uncharacterized protein n=1 Tax=Leptospira borgpetersenii serovar Hardjo-bovis str. Sponselee TaxID=1303729 RepID=M6BEE0_LEPBO|nr:hypothetical protein LBK6_01955 [Leptospira borgpetersenii serovar Hardjo]AWV69107.1 hypothetical protein B9T54_02100 [Leptospira borgpetersenii serovar Hardjo-bovis]EMJ77884.1 hypothetical protein LEP1GSC016_3118 [Leptospira borgpetersenii serovar Hardjo-bovis str. Sponselee]TQE52375.1 hypothetical protein FFZ95_10825 [Leptospira borgpetersenii]AMX60433.1 hypothetical protein LBK9_01950 [Leptospira borgpetersenii serovar Hardjo]
MCQERCLSIKKSELEKKEFFCRIQKIRSFYAFRTELHRIGGPFKNALQEKVDRLKKELAK